MVTIGDKTYPFSSTSYYTILNDSQLFCNKYHITYSECEDIRKYYKSQCYRHQSESISESKSVSESESESELGSEAVIDTVSDIKTISISNDNKNKMNMNKNKNKNIQRIDYSMKVGPILPIYGLDSIDKNAMSSNKNQNQNQNQYDGISFFDQLNGWDRRDGRDKHVIYLQSYSGETPQQSISRFCGAKKLINELQTVCMQIETAFLALYDIDIDIDSGIDSGSDSGSDSKIGMDSDSDLNSDSHSAMYNTLNWIWNWNWNWFSTIFTPFLSFCRSVYRDYFQLIFLLLGILYVLLMK